VLSRTLIHKPPSVERKPPVRPPLAVRAPAPPVAAHPIQALHQRLGSHAAQAFVAQAAAPAAPIAAALPAVASTSAAPQRRGAAAPVEAPGKVAAPAAPPQGPAKKEEQRAAPAAGAQKTAVAPPKDAGEKKGKDPAGAAPPSPRAAIAPAAAAVRQRAGAAKKHVAPAAAVGSAQASAIHTRTEQTRGAAVQTVGKMDAAKPEAVRRGEFKAKLKQAIVDATPTPKTESEANAVMKDGGTKASASLKGELGAQRDAAAGPMKSAAATEVPPSEQPASPETKLQVQPAGPPPVPVSAAPVVPAPLPPQRLDYSADRGPTEQVMAESNVTQEQLKKGNDPAFGPTLDARATAEKHEANAAAQYRQAESNVQAEAQAKAAGALAGGLGGIHMGRVAQLGKVGDKQHAEAARNAAKRQELTDKIKGVKDQTKTKVDAILSAMDDEAPKIFGRGLERAERAYDAAFEDAKGGWGTWITTWGSDWDKHIAKALVKARAKYMSQVDVAIDEVADYVDKKLKEAKDCVADGRRQVDEIVGGLDASLKQFGEEARESVGGDFDAMSSGIDEHRDALVSKLADQYKESYERMSAREEELREANKSLWQRVYDATVGLIKKIIAFKDMLLGLLARAAGVVSDIIDDPIGFLGNLVSGVMLGLKNFMANIGTHLKKGLMDWLFGALAGAGLKLPDQFDLKGILSIVLQILGLTYANFRARAVAIVGEPTVAALEQAAEVFKIFLTEGVGGLWRFIKEKVSDLKSMVLDAIFDFIKEKVIIAGVTWIIGLLNPASAFFKACKAIYDIVMFFINRGSQILALVNAIVDSLAAIVKGNISVAATWVENALAKAIPVAIGFLASLLGLGDPSKPVKNTIEKAQSPVNKAIDWVIHGAVKLVKAAGKFVKGLFGKKNRDDKKNESDIRDAAGNALADIVGPEATVEQAQQAAATVSSNLAGQGLRRLYIGAPDEDGNSPVIAEASPPKRVRILARKRVIVSVEAKVRVSGAPVLEGMAQTNFAKFDKKRAEAIGGTGEAGLTPEVPQPPGTAAKHGTQPSSGLVLKPDKASREVEVVTWNTSQKILQHNPSHAEKQFINWFDARPPLWLKRVTDVVVIVSGRDICELCTGDIANAQERYPWVRFSWTRGDADSKDMKKEKADVKK
jgi:hypothetical protein